MAKARSRTAVRKVKDKWKAKTWYNILAPQSFDNVPIADTLSSDLNNVIDRVTEVSLQDLTNDFRKSHIKLFFKVYKVENNNAYTQFIGHSLTSDYLRRMIRRKRSKIEGVYDVTTRDSATIRVKPFATTDKRIQNSQKRIVRETMKKTISDNAKNSTMSEFIKEVIDGKVGSDIYKNCKKLYPVKRVEIFKTQVLGSPSIEIEEKETTKIIEHKKEESPEDEKKTKSEKKVKKSEEKEEIVEKPEEQAVEEEIEPEVRKDFEESEEPKPEEEKIEINADETEKPAKVSKTKKKKSKAKK
ncbi:MAG: 30S ribosomal protein S3ae [Candidatus Thermoplasmatota archaeon]|nr:30S ribosomal protein S3ae [Candidatus Thermoplasmatota archaeon]